MSKTGTIETGASAELSREELLEQKIIAIEHELQEEKARRIQAETEARTDVNTGMINKRGFVEKFKERRARPSNKKLSILILDVDGFGELNDTYGHPAVDEMLSKFNEFFKSKFARKGDITARYAGDEFIVLFEGDEDDLTRRFFNRRDGRSVIRFETTIDNKPITLTFSGGVADLKGLENPDAELKEALKEADEATYASKNDNKDRITKYSDLKKQASVV